MVGMELDYTPETFYEGDRRRSEEPSPEASVGIGEELDEDVAYQTDASKPSESYADGIGEDLPDPPEVSDRPETAADATNESPEISTEAVSDTQDVDDEQEESSREPDTGGGAPPEEPPSDESASAAEYPEEGEPPSDVNPAQERIDDLGVEAPTESEGAKRTIYGRGQLMAAARAIVRMLDETGTDYDTALGRPESNIRKVLPSLAADDEPSIAQISEQTGLSAMGVTNAIRRAIPALRATVPEEHQAALPQPHEAPPPVSRHPIESDLLWKHGEIGQGIQAAFSALGKEGTEAFLARFDTEGQTHKMLSLAAANPTISFKEIAERTGVPPGSVSTLMSSVMGTLYEAVPEQQRQGLPHPSGSPKQVERDPNRVGVWARDLQIKSGRSVPELADALDISERSLRRFYAGGSGLSPIAVERLLEEQGVASDIIQERLPTYRHQRAQDAEERRREREGEE